MLYYHLHPIESDIFPITLARSPPSVSRSARLWPLLLSFAPCCSNDIKFNFKSNYNFSFCLFLGKTDV